MNRRICTLIAWGSVSKCQYALRENLKCHLISNFKLKIGENIISNNKKKDQKQRCSKPPELPTKFNHMEVQIREQEPFILSLNSGK